MRLASAVFILVAAGPFAAGSSLSAQHATAFDIEDGGRAFRNTCANCHGPDGDQIAGIDLGRGQFRRPLSDEELVGIIRGKDGYFFALDARTGELLWRASVGGQI